MAFDISSDIPISAQQSFPTELEGDGLSSLSTMPWGAFLAAKATGMQQLCPMPDSCCLGYYPRGHLNTKR